MPTKEKMFRRPYASYRPSSGDAAGEIRIETRIKNNRLYEAIVPMFGSIFEFCRRSGLNPCIVGDLINFKRSPFACAKAKSLYTPTARRLAEICGYECADLFPTELYGKVTNNFVAKTISMDRLLADEEARKMLTASTSPDHEARLADTDVVSTALQMLSPTQAEVIRQRFGFSDGMPKTLEEVGKGFGLSRERVRQIECMAIQKLRHPRRARLLSGVPPVGKRASNLNSFMDSRDEGDQNV